MHHTLPNSQCMLLFWPAVSKGSNFSQSLKAQCSSGMLSFHSCELMACGISLWFFSPALMDAGIEHLFYVLPMIHILPHMMSVRILCQCFNWVILLKAYSWEIFFSCIHFLETFFHSVGVWIYLHLVCVLLFHFWYNISKNRCFILVFFILFFLWFLCLGFYIWKL